ncbi:MAG: histidinol-phosphatase [Lentisphaeria bacterium]|nr:histidinol-phosphatase [Lentisphaeria bacterium]
MTRQNFHTHTRLCKHASGWIDDYCQAALSQGVTVLGFSDHTPYPDGRWHGVRMSLEELPAYAGAIAQAKGSHPGLTVLGGMECEHVTEYTDFFRETLLGQFGLDYLVGTLHAYLYHGEWTALYGKGITDDQLAAYADHFAAAIHSGLYAFIAHPDLFGVSLRGWSPAAEACSRTIIKAAATCQVPLEINAYGLRKKTIEDEDGPRRQYPLRRFWEIAAEYSHLTVVVNSDAHAPQDVWGNTDEALDLARALNLRVVNDILTTSMASLTKQ